MHLIDTNEELQDICAVLQKKDFITVDSEFIREHTYYPQLCLIQVAYEENSVIIDPLANIELAPFFEVLQNPNIVKVFHAGRQDIEIFYHLSGKVPQNVFDTQIAAMVCGFAENIGYGNLVREIKHIDLDKTCRLTDWSLRPLDKAQLEYAACDVTHLVDCYKYLLDYMQKHNRTEWIKEEIAALCDEKCYHIDPDEAWHRIKHNIHTPKFLSALKYLAKWREERAQKYNTPRSGILKDDVLLNIASTNPQTIEELHLVRNLKADIIKGKLGIEIIEVLQKARQNPMPNDICRADKKQQIHIPAHEQSLAEILKLVLKIRSQESGVIARLIANDDDLRSIVLNCKDKTMSMQGWRYEIFGKYAEKICKGEIAIVYNPENKTIEFK